jgi:hypothetical protein
LEHDRRAKSRRHVGRELYSTFGRDDVELRVGAKRPAIGDAVTDHEVGNTGADRVDRPRTL